MNVMCLKFDYVLLVIWFLFLASPKLGLDISLVWSMLLWLEVPR